jgi:hypothetical protein
MNRSGPRAGLLALAATALVGCAVEQAGEPTAVPPESRPLVTPSLAPAPKEADCGQMERANCREWTPLVPQPSFFDLFRLDPSAPAPAGANWGALYLCGVLTEDQLTEAFGNDFLRAIVNDFICKIESADHTRMLSVYFGDGSLDEFAQERFGLEKTRTAIHGRDAVVYEHEPSESAVSHEYVLGIPRVDDAVLVVDVLFFSTYQEEPFEIIPPDPEAAQALSDTVATTLIDLSA